MIKSILLWVLPILFCIICSSCGNNAQQLASKLANTPRTNIVGFGEISYIKADGQDLIFVTNAQERYLNYEVIRNNDPKYLIGDNGIIALLHLGVLEDVINNNISIVYRFEWNDGKIIDARFSPSEIQARIRRIAEQFQ